MTDNRANSVNRTDSQPEIQLIHGIFSSVCRPEEPYRQLNGEIVKVRL